MNDSFVPSHRYPAPVKLEAAQSCLCGQNENLVGPLRNEDDGGNDCENESRNLIEARRGTDFASDRPRPRARPRCEC